MGKMIRYKCKKYNDLELDELYAIMVLRQSVFAVEQNCVYLDADGKDQASYHILGVDSFGALQAYSRICPQGVAYPKYASIGRVVVSSTIRSTGEGYRLMKTTLEYFQELFPNQACKISAQSYLISFYKNLGFQPTGQEYFEDGISHIAMIRP